MILSQQVLLFDETSSIPSIFLDNLNWGIILAFLLLTLYLGNCIILKKYKSDLANAAIVFFGGYGIYAGCQLILLCIDGGMDFCINNKGINKIHVIIGGIAVVWASMISVGRILSPPKKRYGR